MSSIQEATSERRLPPDREACHPKEVIGFTALALGIITILGGILALVCISYPHAFGALSIMKKLAPIGSALMLIVGSCVVGVGLCILIKHTQQTRFYNQLAGMLALENDDDNAKLFAQKPFVDETRADPAKFAKMISFFFQKEFIPFCLMEDLNEHEQNALIIEVCEHEDADSRAILLLADVAALSSSEVPENFNRIAATQLQKIMFQKLKSACPNLIETLRAVFADEDKYQNDDDDVKEGFGWFKKLVYDNLTPEERKIVFQEEEEL